MTSVAGAVEDSQGSRVYPVQGIMMPSANTVLGKLDKPGLNIWKMKNAVLGVAQSPRLQQMALDGREYAAAMQALDEAPNDAAELGTAVHLGVEVIWRTGSVDEAMYAVELDGPDGVDLIAVREHLVAWEHARHAFGLIPVFVEQTVCHVGMKYAGTMDFAALFHSPAVARQFCDCGRPHVGDVKTGKLYPEVALQLSAYANATHTWDARQDRVSIVTEPLCNDVGIVASLHAGSCELRPVRLVEAFDTFAAAVLAWAWAEVDSKTALGPVVNDPTLGAPW